MKETAVASAKTAEELRQEIEELRRQQREINERLRDPRGLRRAAFIGSNVRGDGNGPKHSADRGMASRGVIRRANSLGFGEQPATKKRILSTIVKEDEQSETPMQIKAEETTAVDSVDDTKAVVKDQSNGSAPLQQSDNGRQDFRRKNNQARQDIVEPLPRILPKEEDPSLVKRNRRMFSSLLVTLEKFKKEDSQLSGLEVFARRSDMQKRAEAKAQEESERLRQQEREQLAEKRRRDLTLRARLAAKAEEKHLELLFLQWTEHYKQLNKFLRTKAEPPIFFVTAKPLEDFEKKAESRLKDFEEWEVQRREEMGSYQKRVHEEHLANVEAEIERWQSNRRTSGQPNTEIQGCEQGVQWRGGAGSNRLKSRLSKEEEEEVDEDVDMLDDDIVEKALAEEGVVARPSEEKEIETF